MGLDSLHFAFLQLPIVLVEAVNVCVHVPCISCLVGTRFLTHITMLGLKPGNAVRFRFRTKMQIEFWLGLGI